MTTTNITNQSILIMNLTHSISCMILVKYKVLYNSQEWLKTICLDKVMKYSTFSNNKLIRILKALLIIKSNKIKSKITIIRKLSPIYPNTIISNPQTAKNIFKSKVNSIYKKWMFKINNNFNNFILHAKSKSNQEIQLLWKISKFPKNKHCKTKNYQVISYHILEKNNQINN